MDRPLRIVLEFNSVLKHRHSGFWTYGHGLLGGLVQLADVERVTLLYSRRLAERTKDFELRDHPKVRLVPVRPSTRKLQRWWHVVSWPALQRWTGPLDVYHCVHHLMPPTLGRPRVLTVHDLRHYALRQLYGASKLGWFERGVASADRILTYSQCTKADLVKYLHYPAEKIDVAYMGTTDRFFPATADEKMRTRKRLAEITGRPCGPYITANSSPDARKNLPAVLRAFAKAADRLGPDFSLVITGRLPKMQDIPALARELGIESRVLLTGPLADEDFRPAMAGAEAFVFLSLYEGFGLPLLEAMAAGVPVVAAGNSCFPEIVGSDGIIVDEADPAATADAMVRAATDVPTRHRLIALGLERCKLFNWLDTARKTVECYRRAIAVERSE